MLHADQIRARALHDLSRAREALALIGELAESPAHDGTMRSIARLARAALAGATPPDLAFTPGEDHEGGKP